MKEKRGIGYSPCDLSKCRPASPKDVLKYILGLESFMDISKNNGAISRSYQMNMSQRESLEMDDQGSARMYPDMWIEWVDVESSKKFKALSKTVRVHLGGIALALSPGVDCSYPESPNGRMLSTKHSVNGYHGEGRLIRMVFFKDSLRGVPS